MTTPTVTFEFVDFDQASSLLQKVPDWQRERSKPHALKLLKYMTSGNWFPESNDVTQLATGEIVNGQHTLFAIVLGKGSVKPEIKFTRNARAGCEQYFDRGKKRTAPDHASAGRHLKVPPINFSVANGLYNGAKRGGGIEDKDKLIEFYKRYEDAINKVIKLSMAKKPKTRSSCVLGAVVRALVNGVDFKIIERFSDLSSGMYSSCIKKEQFVIDFGRKLLGTRLSGQVMLNEWNFKTQIYIQGFALGQSKIKPASLQFNEGTDNVYSIPEDNPIK
jgi:hypothetical protein